MKNAPELQFLRDLRVPAAVRDEVETSLDTFSRDYERGLRSAVSASKPQRHPRKIGGRKAMLKKGTRKGRKAALKAWMTRRKLQARGRAKASEAASKAAFAEYMKDRGWRVAFFEGPTGSPRTGIIDAVAFRLGRRNADLLDLRLVQLKGGGAGISGREITRLKNAARGITADWLIAAYDPVTETLQLLPGEPAGSAIARKITVKRTR